LNIHEPLSDVVHLCLGGWAFTQQNATAYALLFALYQFVTSKGTGEAIVDTVVFVFGGVVVLALT
jgi:hypothetical protein